jgi:hypothetical protein
MSNASVIAAGSKVTVQAGSRVTRRGTTARRDFSTVVTVRKVEKTRAGRTKIYWKSNGYRASTVLA